MSMSITTLIVGLMSLASVLIPWHKGREVKSLKSLSQSRVSLPEGHSALSDLDQAIEVQASRVKDRILSNRSLAPYQVVILSAALTIIGESLFFLFGIDSVAGMTGSVIVIIGSIGFLYAIGLFVKDLTSAHKERNKNKKANRPNCIISEDGERLSYSCTA